jgi:parallel beta-helix repeat protein
VKKLLVVGIILLLVCVSIPSTGRVMKQSSTVSYYGITLYVGGSGPGNYTKIQDAIDNASDGDTVFVYNGTYYEYVDVDKSINLIGEDKDTTIINGGDSYNVVWVKINKVNITGFTIREGSNGIEIESNYNTISNTTTISNGYGIELKEARYNTIKGNVIISNRFNGIYGDWISDYNVITGNIISDNKYNGITLLESSYNTIKGNNISNNRYAGIYLCWPSGDNTILDNSFFNNGLEIGGLYGNIVNNNTVNGKPLIFLEDESNMVLPEAGQIILIDCDNITIKHQDLSKASVGLTLIKTDNCLVSNNIISSNSLEGIFLRGFSNKITENTISCNRYGIQFLGSGNTIIVNTISNNSCGIYATYNSYNNTIYHNNFVNNTMNAADERNNTWDNGYPSGGNFWDDYNGTDEDEDDIGDTPYPIPGGDNEDRFPLMEPWYSQRVEFVNPRYGYIHLFGKPIVPTFFDLIADTLCFGGFKSIPIQVYGGEGGPDGDQLAIRLRINEEDKGLGTWNSIKGYYEWQWNEKVFGKYNLDVMARDEYGVIVGMDEMNVWNFCLFP